MSSAAPNRPRGMRLSLRLRASSLVHRVRSMGVSIGHGQIARAPLLAQLPEYRTAAVVTMPRGPGPPRRRWRTGLQERGADEIHHVRTARPIHLTEIGLEGGAQYGQVGLGKVVVNPGRLLPIGIVQGDHGRVECGLGCGAERLARGASRVIRRLSKSVLGSRPRI